MSALEILNLMAQMDRERPFSSSDVENESDVLFQSTSDAQRAFKFTNEIRNKICIQVIETSVPDRWKEMIRAYPETQSSKGVKDEKDSTFVSRIFASFRANLGTWGGGFATACLVLVLIEFSDSAGPRLGEGMVKSQDTTFTKLGSASSQAASQKKDAESPHKLAEGIIVEMKRYDKESCGDSEPQSENTEHSNSERPVDCGKDGFKR